MKLAVAAFATLLLAQPAAAQTLSLKGLGGQAATISAAEFAALPRVKVRDFEGVSLAVLLARVGIPAEKPMGGGWLAQVVRITSSDGYTVALAMADLDPATRKGAVFLADRQGGQPLPSGHGPFRLVIEDDLRASRSARQVAGVEVIDLKALK